MIFLMKKLSLAVLGVVLLTIISGCGIFTLKLNGEILLSQNINIYSKKNSDGIMILDVKRNTLKKIVSGIFANQTNIEFNKTKTKILGLRVDSGDYFIFEYDMAKKTFNKIFTTGVTCLKYLPNSNCISFSDVDDKIVIYNRDTRKLSVIVDDASGDYDWSSDGKKLMYANRDAKICLYDIETKEKEQVLVGWNPIFSNNNRYIAYMKRVGKSLILTVYDTESKKDYRINSQEDNREYKFSPDDNYLAFVTQYTDITNNPYFKLYVTDFRTGFKTKLIGGQGGAPAIDWRE